MTVTAIFGGTFDPVHNGHVEMAKIILSRHLADELFFLPAKIPPHKLNKNVSHESVRLQMLESVLTPKMSICTIELERPDGVTSYSYQTMRELKQRYPDRQFKFVMGMDSLNTLHLWREFEKFIDENQFIVFTRPEDKLPPIEQLAANLQGNLEFAIKMLNSVHHCHFPISSTKVREAVANNNDITKLVPDSVAEIIRQEHLYQ